jgi:hypothetical protein
MEQITKPLETVLQEYLEDHYFPGAKPFLQHLDYFKGDDDKLISACSISDKQSALTGESKTKTYVIGKVTISGANNINPNYLNGTCPYKKKFESDDLLDKLTHPCDTKIVNSDGSINVDVLTHFVKTNFEYDKEMDTFILFKNKMMDHMEICKDRDADLEQTIRWFLPSFAMLAYGEWTSFFDVYCDRKYDGEKAVTLNTFLQFYFEPQVLYQKVLTGTLGYLESGKK